MLSEIQNEVGGIGNRACEKIEQEFESLEDFREALEKAYWNLETNRLKQVPFIGNGYARKLARWYGQREGYDGGDAEPTPIR